MRDIVVGAVDDAVDEPQDDEDPRAVGKPWGNGRRRQGHRRQSVEENGYFK